MNFTAAEKEDLLYMTLADMYSDTVYVTTTHVKKFGIMLDDQFKGYITFDAMDKTGYDAAEFVALIRKIVEI
jgi:hypothetical protein